LKRVKEDQIGEDDKLADHGILKVPDASYHEVDGLAFEDFDVLVVAENLEDFRCGFVSLSGSRV